MSREGRQFLINAGFDPKPVPYFVRRRETRLQADIIASRVFCVKLLRRSVESRRSIRLMIFRSLVGPKGALKTAKTRTRGR